MADKSKILPPTPGIDLSNNSPVIAELNGFKKRAELRTYGERGSLIDFANALEKGGGTPEQQAIINDFKNVWSKRQTELADMVKNSNTREELQKLNGNLTYQTLKTGYGIEGVPGSLGKIGEAIQSDLKTMMEREKQLKKVEDSVTNVNNALSGIPTVDNKPNITSVRTNTAFFSAQMHPQSPETAFNGTLAKWRARFDDALRKEDPKSMADNFAKTLGEIYPTVSDTRTQLELEGKPSLILTKCKTIEGELKKQAVAYGVDLEAVRMSKQKPAEKNIEQKKVEPVVPKVNSMRPN